MLFAVSFCLVFLSSYLTASILTNKAYEHFIFLLLTFFAQLVLSFEILSLFTAISEKNLLICNLILFIIALMIWLKKGKPLYYLKPKPFISRFVNSITLDKCLGVLFLGYMVLIISSVFLNLILPLSSADAVDYHVARSVWYVLQGSLNHFTVADIRTLIFPFNTEILYAWVLLLIKKDVLLGFFSFFGYLACITSLYTMMKLSGFSLRKILWTIFLLSSFASVLIHLSSTETDIFVAGLILSSITLFWISIKDNNKKTLVFSTLAYALAIGTKTTAIIAIPAIGIILLTIMHKYKNFKILLPFLGLVLVNFLIFASYSYVLNFIDFGNFMGSKSAMAVHKNFDGIKGMVSTSIRHFFLFFDFSGFKWGDYVGEYISKAKMVLLSVLNVDSVSVGVYSNPSTKTEINSLMMEPSMGLGILGFIVYLPCLIIAFVKQFFTKNSREKLLGILATSFILFVFTLSFIIVYMNFNIRFLTMFVVISSPILAYSYFKKNNILKTIMCLFMLYYLVLASTHIWPRPSWHIVRRLIFNNETISDARMRISCSNCFLPKDKIISKDCDFWLKMTKNIDLKSKNILYMTSSASDLMLSGMLSLRKQANIDLGLLYDYPNINFDKYDLLVIRDNIQYSTVVRNDEININYKLQDKRLDLTQNEPYYCLYYSIGGVVTNKKNINKSLKDYPYAMECFFDDSTLQKHGFKLKGVVSGSFYVYEKI